jgi:hypothetical protein
MAHSREEERCAISAEATLARALKANIAYASDRRLSAQKSTVQVASCTVLSDESFWQSSD